MSSPFALNLRGKSLALACAALLSACAQAPKESDVAKESAGAAPTAATNIAANPLLAPYGTAMGAVPFDQIKIEHLGPALDLGMQKQLEAIRAITSNPEAPTFANTLEAMQRSQLDLGRAMPVFSVYTSNLGDDAVRALEREYSAKMAKHRNAISLNSALFARIKAVHESKATASAHPEAARLAEQTFKNMVRAGAALSEAERQRVAELSQREAELMTSFNQNVLKDTESFVLFLDESDLTGLPNGVRLAAQQSAKDRGQEGKFAFSIQRPDYEAFMTYSERRDLREKMYQAFISRGNRGNEFDNKAVIAELVALRAERAKLLGFPHFAEYVASEGMAQTSKAAEDLMLQVWRPAVTQAQKDAETLRAEIKATGQQHSLEGWDWRFYAERVRVKQFNLSPDEVAPYFGMENMIKASFAVSQRLFGVTFAERKDIPVYHPDVRAFEVFDANKQSLGLFYIDYFARVGKRSGAWMASYRPQKMFDGVQTAHVVNNLNVPKPPAGKPALISLTEAVTLFHELGHGLHGLLSKVHYPSLSGTSVPRDFVEFPAQFMEHYVLQPAILKEFARHVETGAEMPDALIERLRKAEKFNQGFSTAEFLSSALVDYAFHKLTPDQAKGLDVAKFERETLKALGAIEQIPMRHGSTHFSHVFGGGYSAAYYAYMWSEVLDTDGFAAFEESGNIFNPTLAAKLKSEVYQTGNTREGSDSYRAFRGRDPKVEPLLINRGLLEKGKP